MTTSTVSPLAPYLMNRFTDLCCIRQVTAATVHPLRDHFVTASLDMTWAMYDADAATCLVRVRQLIAIRLQGCSGRASIASDASKKPSHCRNGVCQHGNGGCCSL